MYGVGRSEIRFDPMGWIRGTRSKVWIGTFGLELKEKSTLVDCTCDMVAIVQL